MNSRGGPPGRRRSVSAALLLAALAGLYGALLVLYPKAFRRRYSEEMRRDFRELMREGLQEGGATELVRVWAQAFSDLVLTALKERSTLLAARNAQKSVDPRMTARPAARTMVGEAERMLSELEVRGHLEVTVEHGRLHYALWDRDALP